jgi:hypothetical protein
MSGDSLQPALKILNADLMLNLRGFDDNRIFDDNRNCCLISAKVVNSITATKHPQRLSYGFVERISGDLDRVLYYLEFAT